jgi:hypothetical protein
VCAHGRIALSVLHVLALRVLQFGRNASVVRGTQMEIVGFVVAHDAHRRYTHSAMPDAPVVDDGRSPEALAKRRQPIQRLRLSTARTLRRAANRLEPKPA